MKDKYKSSLMVMVVSFLELKNFKGFSRWENSMVRGRWKLNMIKTSIAIKDSSWMEKSMEKAYKNSKAPLMMELLTMISSKAKVTWFSLSVTNLKNNKKNKPRRLKKKTQEKTQKY